MTFFVFEMNTFSVGGKWQKLRSALGNTQDSSFSGLFFCLLSNNSRSCLLSKNYLGKLIFLSSPEKLPKKLFIFQFSIKILHQTNLFFRFLFKNYAKEIFFFLVSFWKIALQKF